MPSLQDRRDLILPAIILTGLAGMLIFGPGEDNTAGPSDQQPVRIGHFPNVTHAQALVARATGQYEKALGVPIKWSSFNAGPTAIEAIFAGEIDATYVGPNPAINGYIRSKGTSFVIVAGAASGGAALVVAPHANITGAGDFTGKTLATPQLGNTQDVAARVWLAEHGHQPREKGGSVTITPLANPDQLLLFQKKEIDAAWTVEPWVSRLEQEADGRVLIDEGTLWPGGRYTTTLLVMSRKFLVERPAAARKLIEAHIDITRQINEDRATSQRQISEQIKILTTKTLPEPVLTSALKRIEFTWDPVGSSLLKVAEDAHRIGFIREKPVLEGIFALDGLNESLKARKLPIVPPVVPDK